MPTFNFTNIATSTTGISNVANDSFSYTEAGFTFSIGVTNGDGDNLAIIANTTTNSGILTFRNGLSGLSSVDQFFIDPNAVGFTKFTGDVTLHIGVEVGAWSANGQALVAGTNVLSSVGGQILFTTSSGGSIRLQITSMTATLNCFCAGTSIATPGGGRAVETLQSGGTILTADGTVTTVRWLGRQRVAADQLHPQKINPIRIRAGALGDGLPHQDLYVSPDHAIELDGLLINAAALTNGSTITQVAEMPAEGFDYYHIETDAHELILAEGVAAETYLESGDLDAFVNLDKRIAPAAPMAEMDLPRVSTKRLLPKETAHRIQPRRVA